MTTLRSTFDYSALAAFVGLLCEGGGKHRGCDEGEYRVDCGGLGGGGLGQQRSFFLGRRGGAFRSGSVGGGPVQVAVVLRAAGNVHGLGKKMARLLVKLSIKVLR
jgi:hypothetical protein